MGFKDQFALRVSVLGAPKDRSTTGSVFPSTPYVSQQNFKARPPSLYQDQESASLEPEGPLLGLLWQLDPRIKPQKTTNREKKTPW